jgi:hypothetical protein
LRSRAQLGERACRAQAFLDDVERRRARQHVDVEPGRQAARERIVEAAHGAQVLIVDVAHPGRDPLRHFDGERNQQEHVSDHRGIEQVLAQPAIELFRENDRDGAA